MAQNNGLQPTQTYTSPADLNKENADLKAKREYDILVDIIKLKLALIKFK